MEQLGNECTNSWYPPIQQNCPNSSNEEECSKKGDNYFYCYLSKTCIDWDKLCDGVVHCIMGEDETLKNCTDTAQYPPNAKEKCSDSSKPWYDIPILAIHCDGLVECKYGEDENHWFCNTSQVSKIFFDCTLLNYEGFLDDS